jgi:hypothetical protein
LGHSGGNPQAWPAAEKETQTVGLERVASSRLHLQYASSAMSLGTTIETGSSFRTSSAPHFADSTSSRHAAQNFAGCGRMLGLCSKHQEASFTSTPIRWQVHSNPCSSSIACFLQNVWPQPSNSNCGLQGRWGARFNARNVRVRAGMLEHRGRFGVSAVGMSGNQKRKGVHVNVRAVRRPIWDRAAWSQRGRGSPGSRPLGMRRPGVFGGVAGSQPGILL